VIQERAEKGNLHSSVIVPAVQFYGTNHNSQSDRWIGLKIYLELLVIFFLCWGKILGQSEIWNALRYTSEQDI
jgi:cytochrome b